MPERCYNTLLARNWDGALGKGKFEHNSFSTADAPGNRAGDFLVGDVTIHVTTSPGETVIERCRENLNDGYKPIIVTIRSRVSAAEGLADNKGVADRIDIFEIEQFVAPEPVRIGRIQDGGAACGGR